MKKLNVALVCLSFGLEFVAIYCKHPDIDKVYVVDKNEKLLNIAKAWRNMQEIFFWQGLIIRKRIKSISA